MLMQLEIAFDLRIVFEGEMRTVLPSAVVDAPVTHV